MHGAADLAAMTRVPSLARDKGIATTWLGSVRCGTHGRAMPAEMQEHRILGANGNPPRLED